MSCPALSSDMHLDSAGFDVIILPICLSGLIINPMQDSLLPFYFSPAMLSPLPPH